MTKRKPPAKVTVKKVATPKPKRSSDPNVTAHGFLQKIAGAVEEAEIPTDAEVSRVMAALGRKGGKIGGRARADGMTKARRSEIALKAARARWDK